MTITSLYRINMRNKLCWYQILGYEGDSSISNILPLFMADRWGFVFYCRFTVQDLLDHRFFQEQLGVHVELAEEEDGSKAALKLWLRMDDNKKLHGKYKDNNAIEFLFELYKDIPEEVAQEMVPDDITLITWQSKRCRCLTFFTCFSLCVSQVVLGFVCKADYNVVAKAIRHRVTAIKRQREKQRRLMEQRKEAVVEEEPYSAPQAPDPSNQRLPPAATSPAAVQVATQVCLTMFPWKQGISCRLNLLILLKIF